MRTLLRQIETQRSVIDTTFLRVVPDSDRLADMRRGDEPPCAYWIYTEHCFMDLGSSTELLRELGIHCLLSVRVNDYCALGRIALVKHYVTSVDRLTDTSYIVAYGLRCNKLIAWYLMRKLAKRLRRYHQVMDLTYDIRTS